MLNPLIFLINPVGLTGLLASGKKIARTVESIFSDKVSPIPGSILLCDLIGGEYHSGVYVGDNEIVHLEGDGRIRAVSPAVFLARLMGLTCASHIFVACDEDGNPIGDYDIAQRALEAVGSARDYNLFFDNCHQFTSGCITGDFENTDNFTWMLKDTAQEFMMAERWLMWDEDEYTDEEEGDSDDDDDEDDEYDEYDEDEYYDDEEEDYEDD